MADTLDLAGMEKLLAEATRNGKCVLCGHGDHAPCRACPSTYSLLRAVSRISELESALRQARADIEAMPFSNKGLRLVPARREAILRIDDALSRNVLGEEA